ncbi:spore coat protein [Clostridium sp. BL-8]|uniref:spore coat protein n=1 Tax=Clostridium sp. BL-8 TaxID=349938 RepID=UPI00098C6DD4|nr:spore coat protein [Clostridium sp. BL-8]OOM74474.1 hypothetical protein CLOBL_43240 [Clostridium sp. BL-8]
MDELSFEKWLGIKGITIIGQHFSYDRNISKSDIISQINLIVELHKTLLGCNFSELSRIKSIIGREVESYKVQIRRLQKHYDYIFNKTCENEVENFILSNGKIMLTQAINALKYIDEHDYFGVIRRSMNRNEICLGKVDKNNLRKNKDKIEIGTVKAMTYNLVEEDLYNYIKRLQRKQLDIDEEELLKAFVYQSHLSYNSIDYLKGLLSYPKDFLKMWERYRNSRKEHISSIYHTLNINGMKCTENEKVKNDSEVLLELQRSLKYESKSFIV